MNKFLKKIKSVKVLTILAILLSASIVYFVGRVTTLDNSLEAATPSFAPGVVTEFWTWHIDSAYTGTSTSNKPIAFVAPAKYNILAVGCRAENIDVGDGNETYYVDILDGASSIFGTSPMNITAQATSVDGVSSLSATTLTKNDVISIAMYGSGTTPSIANCNIWMYVQRTN